MNNFKIQQATDGQWYFLLRSRNNKTVLTSELYKTRQGLINGIRAVKAAAGNRNNFQIKMAQNGQPYFVLRAPNHEVLGVSETYSSSQQLENGINSVKLHAALGTVPKEVPGMFNPKNPYKQWKPLKKN